MVSWGFDVPGLIRRLRATGWLYHAHSSRYGFELAARGSCVGGQPQHLGLLGDGSPQSLCSGAECPGPRWLDRGDRAASQRRQIDVLVQARKSSPYVLKQLVPALRQAGLEVEVQTSWVDDLVDLFNRSTVYLYDSAEYWRGRGVTEGFGLPPLEALACGCVVFSSLNHALADYGDPGYALHQIGCGRLRFDLERIQAAVASPQRWRPSDDRLEGLLHECSEAVLLERWRDAFAHLDALDATSGPSLNSPSTWWLRLQQLLARLQRVVNRLPGWPATRRG